MGNCQASDAASVIVEHPGGKIEKIYWPVIANKVMVSNPGNYVALILTDSVKGESGDGAHKHLKLLRPDDTLLIGHNYRLVSFEEVLMEFSGKSYVKLNKLISLQKAKGSNQEPVQPPNSSSVVKDYRSEAFEKVGGSVQCESVEGEKEKCEVDSDNEFENGDYIYTTYKPGH